MKCKKKCGIIILKFVKIKKLAEVEKMQEEKKEKRSSLAQKVSSFFNRHEILLVPVVYLVVFLMGTGICTISNGIAYLIGEPDTMYIIAIAIVFAVIIAGVVYEHRSGSKMKDSNISDGTE